eukprot:3605020-Ditylum_brightwellii.AAC.1
MINLSIVKYDKGTPNTTPQSAQMLNQQPCPYPIQNQQAVIPQQVVENNVKVKNNDKEHRETEEKMTAMDEKFQRQLDAMRKEFKKDMSSTKKDIENNVNTMVTKTLEMTTNM